MRNTTKFSSQKLDIWNSTDDFSKFAYKSKINELAFNPIATDSWGPESIGPARQWAKNRAAELAGQSLPAVSSSVMAPSLQASHGIPHTEG